MKPSFESVVARGLRLTLLVAALGAASLAQSAETKQSTLVGSDGKNLTASDFAGIMALYLQPNQIQDAKFLFQECFGGGMLPALQGALGNTINWIGGSASTADKPSYGDKDPTKRPDDWTEPLAKELAKKDQKLGDSLKKASDGDESGPKGLKLETPQTASSTNGADIKMSDGKSHHAIIWTGKKDANRHDNDIKAVKDALNTAWAGAPNGSSITEVSTTKQLEDAMKTLKDDGKLNKDEEFLFYATDHGSQKTTIVPDKPRVDAGGIDRETFTLEAGVLEALFLSDPDHTPPQPTLDIFYSGLASADPVFLNGHLLGTLNPSGQDTLFNVDRSFLSQTNEIEIDNSQSTASFLLNLKEFSTGDVNNAISVPEPGTWAMLVAGLLALLRLRRRRTG